VGQRTTKEEQQLILPWHTSNEAVACGPVRKSGLSRWRISRDNSVYACARGPSRSALFTRQYYSGGGIQRRRTTLQLRGIERHILNRHRFQRLTASEQIN